MTFSPKPPKKNSNNVQASDLEHLMRISKKTGESMQQVVDRFRQMSNSERKSLLQPEEVKTHETIKKQETDDGVSSSIFYESVKQEPIPRKSLPQKVVKNKMVNLWRKRTTR